MSDGIHMVSSVTEWPLVSCVMVTRDRQEWAKEAIQYFYAQDYPNRELIVYDLSVEPLNLFDRSSFDGGTVRYYKSGLMPAALGSLGVVRNSANDRARGKLIMHWDDDDWYPSWRIGFQVAAMQSTAGVEACGASNVCYVGDGGDHDDEVWIFDYYSMASNRIWLAPGTLLYDKRLWESNRFTDKHHAGVEARWMASLPAGHKFLNIENSDLPFYLARLHPGNLNPPTLAPPQWRYIGGVSGHQMVFDLLMHRPSTGLDSISPGAIIH